MMLRFRFHMMARERPGGNDRESTGLARPPIAVPPDRASGRERLILAGVLMAALAVYLRCLGNGFVYDDDTLILANPYIGQWSFLWKSLTRHTFWYIESVPAGRYRPLLSIWLALSYHLFGFKPAGWHALMVATHLVAVWLVFKIGLGLTGRKESALLAAALFAVLPIHAEAVVWPAGFGLALAGTLELASFYVFMKRGDGERRNWYMALALYAAALFSHESAAAFPGLVAWYVFLLEPGSGAESRPARFAARVSRALVCMAPFAFEMLLYMAARRYALGFLLSDPANPSNLAPLSQIIMTVPGAFATDLMLLAVPWMAGPAHSLEIVTSPASPSFYLPVAALIALVAGLPVAIWRSPRRRLYLFCAGWIAIALAPMMDLHAFLEDQFIHDNYLYLASLGSCLLLSDWATRVADRGAAASRLVWATAAVLAVSYAGALWNVQHYWHDEGVLFARCVEEFPHSWTCHNSLGMALESRGDLEGAAREFRSALAIAPHRPDTALALGVIYLQQRKPADAIPLISQAAAGLPRAPAFAAQLKLARLYEDEGDLAQAGQALEAALKIDPENNAALYRLGLVHARLGRIREAVSELSRALKLMGDAPAVAYVTLAELYDAQGDVAHRDEVLQHARSLPDGDQAAGLAYARIKAREGDLKGAEDILRDLARRHPDDSRSWTALGLLLADDNRGEESLGALDRAQQLSPADPQPHFFAARVLHAMGRDRDALEQCRRALALAPGYDQARALQDEILRNPARG